MSEISRQEFQRRRQALVEQMQPGSAALIFAAPEVTRSADSEYPYRQNSDFWYFTGFNEPEAVLVLIKSDDTHNHSVLFNRVRDLTAEIWFGRRLGQDAAPEKLGVDRALAFSEINQQLYQLLNGLDVVYHAQGEYAYADEIVNSALEKLRKGSRQNLTAPATMIDWRPVVHEMRLFKSPEEIAVLRRAGEITAMAHTRAMEKCRPGMFEYHLEGEIHHEFNRHGARYPSYNTIVGSGENGCILHYTENEDVHDVGVYGQDRSRILEPGMVLTVEPGLYIAPDADVPEQYRGIGIRIEDDIVITETGNENLTASVVKKPEEIEALMAAARKQ